MSRATVEALRAMADLQAQSAGLIQADGVGGFSTTITGKESFFWPAGAWVGDIDNNQTPEFVQIAPNTAWNYPNSGAWKFSNSSSADQRIHTQLVLPKRFNGGNISVRHAWTAESGTGDCYWSQIGRYLDEDESLNQTMGGGGNHIDAFVGAALDINWTAASSFDYSGTGAGGRILNLVNWRRVTNGSDTFSGDALFLGTEFTYDTNALWDD